MKVAILIPGHMRAWESTIGNMMALLIKPLSADVFVHTWNVRGNWKPSQFGDETNHGSVDMSPDFIDMNEIRKIFGGYLKDFVVEDYEDKRKEFENAVRDVCRWRDTDVMDINGHGPELYKSYTPQAYYSQYYKWFMCNELKKRYEEQNNFKYDLVFRARMDILINGQFPQQIFEDPSNVYVQIRPDPNNKTWVNDQLIISNSSNIDIMTHVYPEYEDKFVYARCHQEPQYFFEVHTLLWKHTVTHNINLVEVPLPFVLWRGLKSIRR